MLTAPVRTAVVANRGAGHSAALLTYRSTDPAGDLADGPYPALTRAYRDSGWLLPELLDQLGQAESVYFDSVTQVRADHWSRGRVVLLGDAAWCLTLFAAAGASLALTGADLLGAALARHPEVPTALTAWETELRPQVDSRNGPAAATPPNAPQTAACEPGRVTSSCARPRCRRSPGSSSGSSGSTDDPGQAALPGSPRSQKHPTYPDRISGPEWCDRAGRRPTLNLDGAMLTGLVTYQAR
jgi:hypothetical protein